MWEKLKSWLADDTVFYSSFFLLVALISFGLGRLSVFEVPESATPAAITVSQPTKNAASMPEVNDEGEEVDATSTYFVGSQNGSKYHLPWCPSTQQITDSNLVRFESREAAEAQGYTPAANCPGL